MQEVDITCLIAVLFRLEGFGSNHGAQIPSTWAGMYLPESPGYNYDLVSIKGQMWDKIQSL